MAVIPGTNYIDPRESLLEKIRDGTVSVLEKDAENNQACYFCYDRLKGKMIVIYETRTINNRLHESKYYVGMNCYEEAKQFPELVKQRIRKPFSIN